MPRIGVRTHVEGPAPQGERANEGFALEDELNQAVLREPRLGPTAAADPLGLAGRWRLVGLGETVSA
jgi:hypothetical protein